MNVDSTTNKNHRQTHKLGLYNWIRMYLCRISVHLGTLHEGSTVFTTSANVIIKHSDSCGVTLIVYTVFPSSSDSYICS